MAAMVAWIPLHDWGDHADADREERWRAEKEAVLAAEAALAAGDAPPTAARRGVAGEVPVVASEGEIKVLGMPLKVRALNLEQE